MTDLLPALGVFVKRDFLDPETCADLRRQMAEAEARPSPVGTLEGDVKVLVEKRNALLVDLPEAPCRLMEDRLKAVQPQVEAVTKDSYSGLRPMQWLLYGPGHYHRPHTDYYDEPDWERRISILTFLNGEADKGEETFSGGELVLYGLLGPERGIPVRPEPGLAVGFRADTVHEVRPVTRGRRYTALSWFTV
jgi:predicted 2-oxoglutarate/Fe(II)-dependent dioxygenase YbiX